MASKDINLVGAVFYGVPQVDLPINGGGTASFVEISDTTATAADVKVGTYFYTASGQRTEGTASGGGGGASNVVEGSFTTGATGGTTQTINLSYTGTGHPLYIGVYPSDGYASGSELYNITHQYAVISYCLFRSFISSDPTYTGTGTYNQGYVSALFKGSSATNTSSSRTNGASVFTQTAAASGAGTLVRFSSNKTMSIYISSGTNNYGFMASKTYKYVIVYTS